MSIQQDSIELYKYFSTKLFAVRFAIFSLFGITLAAAFQIGVDVDPHGRLGLWYTTGVATGLLWFIENGYFYKFNRVVVEARRRQRLHDRDAPSFFLAYEPFTHRSVYLCYGIAVVSAVFPARYVDLSRFNITASRLHLWLLPALLMVAAFLQMGRVASLWAVENRRLTVRLLDGIERAHWHAAKAIQHPFVWAKVYTGVVCRWVLHRGNVSLRRCVLVAYLKALRAGTPVALRRRFRAEHINVAYEITKGGVADRLSDPDLVFERSVTRKAYWLAAAWGPLSYVVLSRVRSGRRPAYCRNWSGRENRRIPATGTGHSRREVRLHRLRGGV
jgi:hypothetical protein